MVETYSMMDVAPTVSVALGLSAPADAKGSPIPDVVADLAGVERIAVLAPDAFGWYAWSLWQREMPYLVSLHARHSLILRSVLPSITAVNFSTMVTGTDLEGHGVRTYDHDFQAETLFDVVRAAGKRSAAVGFEGYTGSKLLARYSDIDGTTVPGTDDKIADTVIRIAEAQRPEYLIAQLGRVDDVFHQFGPSSPEVVPMLRATDARLQRLVEHLKPLGYGVIILADHGQHDIVNDPTTTLKGGHGSDSDQDCQVPCTWL
ncbi:MAG: alkaline phosphatase family protein [Anaerolineae bacterium]|nr:alkaline phosphatase family protein [Anaerolineae bacterium]